VQFQFDKVVRQIFERMKAIPKSEIVNIRYREKMEERKALLKSAKSDYAKAAAELDTLRAEVIKSLRGESAFSQDLLGSLISDCETKCLEVQHTKLVRQIFERMKAIPKSDIVNIRYREKMEERKSLLHSVRAEYAKAAADLETLKGEVIKTIRGESTFSKELLSSLIAEAEAKCQELQENMETAQAAYDEGKTVLASLNAQYDDIISWAEMYDTASMEAKKMIVNCLIKRVDVYRDYKLHIDFNIDFEQFCGGLDIVTIAA